MSPARICIVSHAAFGALTGSSRGHIGGVERQTSLLAKWLAAQGHSVDILTWRESQAEESWVDGVRVIALCRRDEGLPGVRFFHPRWTSLLRALRRSDADVYYHNTAEYVTGQVALWCASAGRRFVFSSAHDADCDAALPLLHSRRERVLYRLGLRLAHQIVVQTETQRRTMRAGFGRESVVIPMPCPEPSPEAVLSPSDGPRSPRILWVGRLCREKRPDLLLDVAQQTPDVAFDLVGPIDDDSSFGREIVRRAERIANVRYHGAVHREAMPSLYRDAACLLCTSSTEGFPNTFLEAWSLGLPVVSTFDPDQLIRTRRLGIACESRPDDIRGALSELGRTGSWAEFSRNAREYYLSTHRPLLTFSAFESVLLESCRTRAADRARVSYQP